MDEAELVRAFYNRDARMEWGRLDRHPVEFAVTKRYLERYIQPRMRVLDIGGGPGRYALYLAQRGCDVTLLELAEANVDFARARAAELALPLRALQGDAREADRLVEGPFDAVLLMGPLYHLLAPEQRARAVRAALGLLRPGGLLFAAFISLNAGMIYYLKEAPEDVLLPAEQAYIRCFLRGETYAGDAFTKACFIAPREIVPFMEGLGLVTLHLFGQEGITAPNEANVNACGAAALERWIELALATCEREEYRALSEHLMYVGRKP